MKKLALIAFVLIFAAGTAVAQQGGPGQGGGKGKPGNGQQGGGSYGDPIARMTELLDLSDEQITKLEIIFENSQAVREEAREQMREAAEFHREAVRAQVEGVLLPEQAALWKEHQLEREALRKTLEEMGYGRGNGGAGNGGNGGAGGGRGTGDCNG